MAVNKMAVHEMDQLDKELLNLLQSGLPLVPRPFQNLGESLGMTEKEVLSRTAQMKQTVIRQISAIFDTRTLGYQSSQVAAKINPEHLNWSARVFNQHPGVTHNYKRNHAYNLWFTIAVPPDSRIGLQKTVEMLGEEAQAEVVRLMPTLRLFKIGVQLDMTGKGDATKAKAKPLYTEQDREQADTSVTEEDKRIIRTLQQDLPVEARPFDEWAMELGMSVEDLLAYAQRFVERRQMRRLAAVIYHRKAGFRANGMGVWAVPDERVEEVGPVMASFQSVSHCYLRPTYSDWPYTIFTMVHGRSKEECEDILSEIEKETGIMEREVLYSTVEYKKTRLQYFMSDMEAWEAKAAERWNMKS